MDDTGQSWETTGRRQPQNHQLQYNMLQRRHQRVRLADSMSAKFFFGGWNSILNPEKVARLHTLYPSPRTFRIRKSCRGPNGIARLNPMVCQIWKNYWQVVVASMNQKETTETIGGVSIQTAIDRAVDPVLWGFGKNKEKSIWKYWTWSSNFVPWFLTSVLRQRRFDACIFGSSMDRLAHSLRFQVLASLLTIYEKVGRCSDFFAKGCEGQRSKMILILTERPVWVFTFDFSMILI